MNNRNQSIGLKDRRLAVNDIIILASTASQLCIYHNNRLYCAAFEFSKCYIYICASCDSDKTEPHVKGNKDRAIAL